jgi:hypothetical protein
MPTFRLRFNGSRRLESDGPVLSVRIGFDQEWERNWEHNLPAYPYPALPADLLPALVDTGASESSIDCDLALSLGLPYLGQRETRGTQGARQVHRFQAHVYIPAFNRVVRGEFDGAVLAGGGSSRRALLGRTFLRDYTMMYDGRAGCVTFSWD